MESTFHFLGYCCALGGCTVFQLLACYRGDYHDAFIFAALSMILIRVERAANALASTKTPTSSAPKYDNPRQTLSDAWRGLSRVSPVIRSR